MGRPFIFRVANMNRGPAHVVNCWRMLTSALRLRFGELAKASQAQALCATSQATPSKRSRSSTKGGQQKSRATSTKPSNVESTRRWWDEVAGE